MTPLADLHPALQARVVRHARQVLGAGRTAMELEPSSVRHGVAVRVTAAGWLWYWDGTDMVRGETVEWR